MARASETPSRRLLFWFRLVVPLALLAIAISLLASTERLTDFADSSFPLATIPVFDSSLAGMDPAPVLDLEELRIPLQLALESGGTLGGLLQTGGLEPAEARRAIEVLGEYVDVRRLRPGQTVSFFLGDEERPDAVSLRVEDRGRVHLARAGEGWDPSWEPFERTVQTRTVQGVLTGALETAIVSGGGSSRLAFKMAEVLQWDLDFHRDLRTGDRFEVLYEEVVLDGSYAGLGNILALRYVNAGRELEAYRYGEDNGYYGPDGRPLEKMFLRSPLTYSRITSRFNLRRFHPVLKRYRPHYGVDYGTPVGTPVRATAGGVVTFAGWNKGGGKVVKVRHANSFLTAYLHLSRFAKGIAPGRRVSQGEVVAYSGNTGLSTGPHLDYRVQHRGKWIDPLSLKNVPAQPIPVAEVESFYAWRDLCRTSLEEGIGLPPEESLRRALQLAAEDDSPSPTATPAPSSSSVSAGR
ncbi:MAG: peptidoglycan DD-metalloendopeptidase family protein [Acidobacteriota bacterium]